MNIDTYWLQISTATLQMGAGAIIAITTAWLLRRGQNRKITRENRRIQILEEITSQVADLTHTFAKYSTLVLESTQYLERWPVARKEELEKISEELTQEFKKIADAQAKLLMLGEKNLELGLRVYTARMTAWTRQVYVGRRDLTPEQASTLKNAIGEARDLFYELLSRKYDRLLASA
ncbi:Hypothetical protein HDN1F_24060 [gamma proteobacterium HdN1]|nr:Hypothetical protein HDN1F_24060 [gamma proteobacterium HdN1]